MPKHNILKFSLKFYSSLLKIVLKFLRIHLNFLNYLPKNFHEFLKSFLKIFFEMYFLKLFKRFPNIF